jgi:hypothetical protein
VDVIEYCGGVVSNNTGLVDNELASSGLTCATATPGQLKDAQEAARERVLACAFLLGSNRARYRKLPEDLENDHTQGTDSYPSTLQQVYTLLVHWKQDPWNVVHLVGGVSDGVAFTNVGNERNRKGQLQLQQQDCTQ